MGSELFPSALYSRISPKDYEADKEDAVTIQQARDLSEFRLYHGTQWKCSFTLICRTAAERTTFRNFRDARYGAWDSFYFTSRDDLVQRHVRFDSCTGKKTGPTTWEYDISLVEVIS